MPYLRELLDSLTAQDLDPTSFRVIVGLLALARFEANPVVSATLTAASWVEDGLEVFIDAVITGRPVLPSQLMCEVRQRDGGGGAAFPMVCREVEAPEYGQTVRYGGLFPTHSIRALVSGTYDVHLVNV